MEITNIPTPTLPEWVKLYNTYDPEHYAPGKRVSAEEWNTLFLASVRQGNYNADTLELLINMYLPETYQTIANFDKFANMLRTDFAEVQNTIEAFTERVEKVEDIAYPLDDAIQEANHYAKQAYAFSEEANAAAQNALSVAESTIAVADSAIAVSTSANSTSQTALLNSQTAINMADKADTQSTQAITAANSASLRSEDAIATANAAKAESSSAKNTADTAVDTAENATTISEEARTLAQQALDQVVQGTGTQVKVNGTVVSLFDADTKADKSSLDALVQTVNTKAGTDYVDQKVADLVGAAPDTLNTLDELAGALKDNADIITVLENSIANKVNKTNITDYKSVGSLAGITSWANNSTIPTLNTLAYWNGSYASNNNSSNLKYCNNGEIVGTKGDQIIGGVKTLTNSLIFSGAYPHIKYINSSGDQNFAISCDGNWDGDSGEYVFAPTEFRPSGARAGKQSLTGWNTGTFTGIVKSNSGFTHGVTNVVKGTTPSSTVWSQSGFMDKNGVRLGGIENGYSSTQNRMNMIVYPRKTNSVATNAQISVFYDANDTIYTYAPTPPATDNSTQIATTAWVNSKCAFSSGTGTLNSTFVKSGVVQWIKLGRLVLVNISDMVLYNGKAMKHLDAYITGLPQAGTGSGRIINIFPYPAGSLGHNRAAILEGSTSLVNWYDDFTSSDGAGYFGVFAYYTN